MKSRSLLALAAAVLAGCASGPPAPFFVESTTPLAPPPADKTQIVFLDPTNTIQNMIPT